MLWNAARLRRVSLPRVCRCGNVTRSRSGRCSSCERERNRSEARAAYRDPAYRSIPVRVLGIPADRFVDHGSVADLRRLVRIDVPGLLAQVDETLAALGLEVPVATRS